jgi:hypothetical protein
MATKAYTVQYCWGRSGRWPRHQNNWITSQSSDKSFVQGEGMGLLEDWSGRKCVISVVTVGSATFRNILAAAAAARIARSCS